MCFQGTEDNRPCEPAGEQGPRRARLLPRTVCTPTQRGSRAGCATLNLGRRREALPASGAPTGRPQAGSCGRTWDLGPVPGGATGACLPEGEDGGDRGAAASGRAVTVTDSAPLIRLRLNCWGKWPRTRSWGSRYKENFRLRPLCTLSEDHGKLVSVSTSPHKPQRG